MIFDLFSRSCCDSARFFAVDCGFLATPNYPGMMEGYELTLNNINFYPLSMFPAFFSTILLYFLVFSLFFFFDFWHFFSIFFNFQFFFPIFFNLIDDNENSSTRKDGFKYYGKEGVWFYLSLLIFHYHYIQLSSEFENLFITANLS